MKYAVLIGDGMADWAIGELSGKTPLEVANIPNMDYIAKHGQCGLVRTVPEGMEPGSDVAIMSILGYNPKEYYTGRGPLEAASLGINLSPTQIAFRCNLVTVEEGRMKDYSAGHISTEEATELMDFLQEKVGTGCIRFYPGVSYRNLLIIEEEILGDGIRELICTPPHDILDKEIEPYLPKGNGTELLNEIIKNASDILMEHPVNRKRIEEGKLPANMVWLWGFGKTPVMKSFYERFGVKGGLISAVGLLKGLGKMIGFDIIEVPGITGYYDTNYEGKGVYGSESLHRLDLMVVHVESPDEAGHNGELDEKIKAIEGFDKYIVGRILKELQKFDEWRIMVLPDHPTPIEYRTHTAEPVPVAMCGTGIEEDSISYFSEEEVKGGSLSGMLGYNLMNKLILDEERRICE